MGEWVSGWVGQSVIHSFRFGDSYCISELVIWPPPYKQKNFAADIICERTLNRQRFGSNLSKCKKNWILLCQGSCRIWPKSLVSHIYFPHLFSVLYFEEEWELFTYIWVYILYFIFGFFLSLVTVQCIVHNTQCAQCAVQLVEVTPRLYLGFLSSPRASIEPVETEA